MGDSASRREETEATLKAAGDVSHLHEKGQAGKPLSATQQRDNRTRSRIRARVEHVFGFPHTRRGGKWIRTLGKARAAVKIGLMNLIDNLMRYTQWVHRSDSLRRRRQIHGWVDRDKEWHCKKYTLIAQKSAAWGVG